MAETQRSSLEAESRRGIDLKKIASQMNGASGAESKAVCTEAGVTDGWKEPRRKDLLPWPSQLLELCSCDHWLVTLLQAGMFALRERRQHVTQEDFEMAVSKVMKNPGTQCWLWSHLQL